MGEPLPHLRSTISLTGANRLYIIGGSDWTSLKSKNFARRLSSKLNSQILRRTARPPQKGPNPKKTSRRRTRTSTKTRRNIKCVHEKVKPSVISKTQFKLFTTEHTYTKSNKNKIPLSQKGQVSTSSIHSDTSNRCTKK